jgi:Xaa-Pro dipeptidase
MTTTSPNPSTIKKIEQIQAALREYKIDGWLFYDFWKRNEYAQRILEYPAHLLNTRRFFYLIPANGVPQMLVHSIERWNLDHLPGEKTIFLSWQSLESGLKKILSGVKTVAMEYSPANAIPYISKVDAGTVETVRKHGVNVVSSMDLAQYFESRWSDEAYFDNLDTAATMHSIVYKTFAMMGDAIRAKQRITEYDVQQFMMKLFGQHGLVTPEAPNCSVNANSGNPHYEPTKDVHAELHEGDFVLIDLWAKKNKPGATYNDITWVGYLGSSVPEKYTKIFSVVKGARDAAVEFLRESFAQRRVVRGCDVDDVSRAYIVKHGFGEFFIHRTGHSITEDLHGSGANMDNLETRDERQIIPQTSFSIEPGIYFMGDFGIRSEINVYISKNNEIVIPGEPRQQEIIAILQ